MAATKEKVKKPISGKIEERLNTIETKLDKVIGIDFANRLEKDVDRMGDCYDDMHQWVSEIDNIVTKIRTRMGI